MEVSRNRGESSVFPLVPAVIVLHLLLGAYHLTFAAEGQPLLYCSCSGQSTDEELTRHLRGEAEGIELISLLVFWSITANARKWSSPTDGSRIEDWVLDSPVSKPARITPVQTLRPGYRRRHIQIRNVGTVHTLKLMHPTCNGSVPRPLLCDLVSQGVKRQPLLLLHLFCLI